MNDPNAPNPDSARRDRSPRDEASTRHARQAPTVSRDEDRGGYVYFSRIATRWIDNDVYGHVNNAVYYQFFDTVANAYLMEHAGLDIECSATVAFVVASSCRYHAPLRHPAALDVGFRVNRIGRSSVEYGVAVFEAGSDVARWLGLAAVVLASVNIFGGFAVTERMLAMYKKKDKS